MSSKDIIFLLNYVILFLLFWIWVEVYALLLKCKELISWWMLYFCWTILFWIWVKNLKCVHCFLGCKKIISRWMLHLILCKLKWVVLHSCQPNTTRLLSMSNGLGQVNPPYQQVGLGLKDHDMIIKWVGLGLSHLVEYPYLDTTRTRHANPNWHP